MSLNYFCKEIRREHTEERYGLPAPRNQDEQPTIKNGHHLGDGRQSHATMLGKATA